ncbi:MAG: lytic transglycosylase domain-containing protein [Rhodospirillales bacterium]|nr:lytic transglycosylase domain-containing protein [Alphaproteobacteria bacterium]MCB1839948.1 lytic transglycosylase domain-containing protein [Alphaproteobacteria bacterium]MCB9977545.1 lytic transglycosylase domain-containing protein [Rhodospirillales bacterium]
MPAKTLLTCLLLAAQTYNVPPVLLAGIYKAEGGRVGQEVANSNGTYDLGPMQINTIWVPVVAKKWGVTSTKARKAVRDDACTNVSVAAWILRNHLSETESLARALSYYHSRTPSYGQQYQMRVIGILRSNGLLKTER